MKVLSVARTSEIKEILDEYVIGQPEETTSG